MPLPALSRVSANSRKGHFDNLSDEAHVGYTGRRRSSSSRGLFCHSEDRLEGFDGKSGSIGRMRGDCRIRAPREGFWTRCGFRKPSHESACPAASGTLRSASHRCPGIEPGTHHTNRTRRSPNLIYGALSPGFSEGDRGSGSLAFLIASLFPPDRPGELCELPCSGDSGIFGPAPHF
jgi:hypothetical protein